MTTTPTPWKGATQINSTDKFNQYNAQITPLANGGYVAVWTDTSLTHNPNGTTVVGQVYSVLGNKVGGEVTITGLTAGDHYDEAITTLSNGNVAVAFVNHSTGHTLVRIFDPALHFLRQDDLGSVSGPPAISAFPDGGYAVVSMQSGGFSILTTIGPSGAPGLGLRSFGGHRDNAELATPSNGTVIEVWEDHDTGGIGFGTFTFSATRTTFVQNSLAVVGTRPDIAALRGGGFVIAWSENSDVKMAVFRPGVTPPTTGVTVNTSTAGDQHDASLTALADGGFLVTWDDDKLGKQEGQRFDALDHKIGGEFTINNFSSPRAGLLTEDTDGARLSDGRVALVMNHQAGDYDVRIAIFDPRTSPITGTAGGEAITSRVEGATVNGLGGNDTLFGNNGPDFLDGGTGADLLLGGAGSDHYRFSTALGAGNIDTIAGFSHKDDTIELDNAIFPRLKKEGVLKDKFFHVGKDADDHDDHILYNKKTGAVSYDADGSKHKVAPVEFAHLDAHLKLSHGDFLVV